MKIIYIIALLFSFSTQLASASPRATITPCSDWIQNMQFIVSPWKDNTQTFYNDRMRIVHIDTMGEPACCSSSVLLFMPDSTDPLGGNKCFQIGTGNGLGFESVRFSQITRSYSPFLGLLLNIPVTHYIDGQMSILDTAKVRINMSLETATIE